MHRFTTGDYLLRTTKDRILLITSNRRMLQLKGETASPYKKELIPFATAWMELESIMLSEISQVVRDKYHMISPLTGT